MPPTSYIGPRLHQLDQLITQVVNHLFSQMELTSTQSHILHYLGENEGSVIYPKDIEKRFGLTHPTVSGVLQRLEAKQYIVCTPDPKDRRYKRVALSDRARQHQQQICHYLGELEQTLVRGMSADELQTYLHLLEISAANLRQFIDKEEFNV